MMSAAIGILKVIWRLLAHHTRKLAVPKGVLQIYQRKRIRDFFLVGGSSWRGNKSLAMYTEFAFNPDFQLCVSPFIANSNSIGIKGLSLKLGRKWRYFFFSFSFPFFPPSFYIFILHWLEKKERRKQKTTKNNNNKKPQKNNNICEGLSVWECVSAWGVLNT